MKFLNLCAGANRNQSPEWVNLDMLHPVLAPGTPERIQLDGESNYVEHDVLSGMLPFPDDHFTGALLSHCVEHWDCQEAVRVLRECLRVLTPGGVLLVSVPDASYHRQVWPEDTVENAERLFGEPIHLPDGELTFLGYSLFNRHHKQVLTENALWCILVRAGLDPKHIRNRVYPHDAGHPHLGPMVPMMNRRKFSLEMWGLKE